MVNLITKHFENLLGKKVIISTLEEWLFKREEMSKISQDHIGWYICYGLCEYAQNTAKDKIKIPRIEKVKQVFRDWFKQFKPLTL